MISKRGSMLASLLGLAALACTHQLEAQGIPYEMKAYVGGPGGAELLAGRHSEAIAAASRPALLRRDHVSALRAATTLCVAYTVRRSFREAYEACDDAVTLARRVDRSPGTRIRTTQASADALTNRGVLRAVSGDALGAAQDLRRAARLADDAAATARNLAKLVSTPAYRVASARD